MSGLATAADFGGLIDRLVRRAAQLGAATARARSLTRTHPDRAWRSASVLWPLFTTGVD